jgi:hypothetical protein
MKRMWGVALPLMVALGIVPSLSFAQAGLNAGGSQQAEISRVVLLGFVQDGKTTLGILGWEGLVYLVREGDTILGTYRVERLGEDFVILRDGATRIRASFRSKPIQAARVQSRPPGVEDDDDLPPPDDETSQGTKPLGAGGASGSSAAGSTSAAGASPTSPFDAANAEEGAPQAQEENPFAKALRERLQGNFVPSAPQENPFLRALQERASPPASSQDNPLQQAPQQGAPAPPAVDNPFLRALGGQGR